jgi:hypothetical protein
MRLVFKETGKEVKVGDVVSLKDGNARVNYFREPHKPASEGKITVEWLNGKGGTAEFFVSVVGAEWIEREDRSEDDFDDGSGDEEPENPPKSPEKGINIQIRNLHAFKFEAVHDSDNDWVLYSPDVESCEGNSREQMDHIAAVVNAAPKMLSALRYLQRKEPEALDETTHELLNSLSHIT